jgi:hypothetical protein
LEEATESVVGKDSFYSTSKLADLASNVNATF